MDHVQHGAFRNESGAFFAGSGKNGEGSFQNFVVLFDFLFHFRNLAAVVECEHGLCKTDSVPCRSFLFVAVHGKHSAFIFLQFCQTGLNRLVASSGPGELILQEADQEQNGHDGGDDQKNLDNVALVLFMLQQSLDFRIDLALTRSGEFLSFLSHGKSLEGRTV